MKIKTAILTGTLAIFSVFALASVSQTMLGQTQSDDSSATGSAMTNCSGHAGMMGGGMMGNGMMAGGMNGQAMMGHHNAMQKLINQLTADISSARAEANSPESKTKLDDASSIIAELEGEMSHMQVRMHNMMVHMQNCPATQTNQTEK